MELWLTTPLATPAARVVIVVIFIDYNTIAKVSPIIYGIFIILLIAVLFTKPVNGARSWYTITETLRFQPSELAKIFVIMFLASNGAKKNNKIEVTIEVIIINLPANL